MEFSGEILSKDSKNIKDCMSILYKFPKLVFRVSEMRELNFDKDNSSKDYIQRYNKDQIYH